LPAGGGGGVLPAGGGGGVLPLPAAGGGGGTFEPVAVVVAGFGGVWLFGASLPADWAGFEASFLASLAASFGALLLSAGFLSPAFLSPAGLVSAAFLAASVAA
jgi:hypothetical protein